MANGNVQDQQKKPSINPLRELDESMVQCGFGRFHFRVMLAALLGGIANVLVTANTSYLLPNAECDLNMNLMQKGMIGAATYAGMLLSGSAAGYLSDRLGRRPFLIWCYIGTCLCALFQGSSQTFNMLLIGKIIEGVFFAAEFNAVVAYVSEMSHRNIRDKVMLANSSFVSISQVIIALFSWGILTQDWNIALYNGNFVLHSWNFYLYICALFPLSASIFFMFLPESPKFLASRGRYEEAMKIVKNIYQINTGKSLDTFKGGISAVASDKDLTNIKKDANSTNIVGLSVMFRRPLLGYLLMICFVQFLIMLVYNVLRLWYPQLSTIIEHYSAENNGTDNLCVMLDDYTSSMRTFVNSTEECIPNKSGVETYINNMILGCICVLPYLVSGSLVNRTGKKPLLLSAGVLCFAMCLGLRWTMSSVQVLILYSITVALSQAIMSLQQAFVVELFPTTAKSLAISLVMMVGRLGTLSGNLAFPVILPLGCQIAFFSLAGVVGVATCFFVLLPSRQKTS